jgi:excisionase family DNA binding protein
MAQPKLLTSSEAVEHLNIDRSTLTRWVASGRIEPAHKGPGRTGGYVFTADEVDRVRTETRAAAS